MTTTKQLLEEMRQFEATPEGMACDLSNDLLEILVKAMDTSPRLKRVADLADASGVARSTIFHVMSGKKDTRLLTVCKLFHALGLRPTISVKNEK